MWSDELQLSDEMRKRIEQLAAERQQQPEDIVRAAIEAFVAVQQNGVPGAATQSDADTTPYEILERIGFIGGGSNEGPADLSSNKKHLEGFGESA